MARPPGSRPEPQTYDHSLNRAIEATVRSALAAIDASDRDVWIRMGFAVYSGFGDSGFDIWDNWSRT